MVYSKESAASIISTMIIDVASCAITGDQKPPDIMAYAMGAIDAAEELLGMRGQLYAEMRKAASDPFLIVLLESWQVVENYQNKD